VTTRFPSEGDRVSDPTGERHLPSVHQLVASARRRFRQAGISDGEADLDARLLAQAALGWDAARFFASAAERAPAGFDARYEPLVARRAAREPYAYIVGRQEFWGLEMAVSPAVLIPRPETEVVLEAALDLVSDKAARLRAVDACTGSGCLAVALARELSKARVVATDVSAAALDVARVNVARHAVTGRIGLVRTDLLAGLRGPFDLIVSNPPYVPTDEIGRLQPEVRSHEPVTALAAGADGVLFIRRLLDQSGTRLRPGAVLVFEFGFGQARAVSELVSMHFELRLEELRRDLQGIERVAVVRRV
jgi:release factor glutamine methyltransferase